MRLEKGVPYPKPVETKKIDYSILDGMEVNDSVYCESQNVEVWRYMKDKGWTVASKYYQVEGKRHMRTWRMS